MAVQDSYVFQILRILAENPDGLRTNIVLEKLDAWRKAKDTMFGPSNLVEMRAALESLASEQAGFLIDSNGDDLWRPTRVGRPGDGGGRDDGNGGNGVDGQDGGGGGGLAEVLSHPVLFCMTETDQDNLIAVALGLSPEGMQA